MHCTHVPPPPHADGKKIPASLSVVKTVFPPSTSNSFSPLIISLILPAGDSLDFVNNKILTNAIITVKKTTILLIIVDVLNNII